jgi:AcrR family transcriptional regulator
MPRIAAPTLVEHHTMRRAAVVAAARSVLGAAGAAAVTPAAVARGAGLARTSVYQYYPSTAALLAAAVEAMFADAQVRLAQALLGVTSPAERVRTYVLVAVRTASDRCGPFHGLTGLDLPEPCRARVRELHEQVARPLRDAVADLGEPEPDVVTALLLGAIGSAALLIRAGADVDRTAATTARFARDALHRSAD